MKTLDYEKVKFMSQEFTPNRHFILRNTRTVVGRWLERNRKRIYADLFLYFHRFTKNFVIARWTNKKARLFTEILNLGKSPNNFISGDIKLLAFRLQPTLKSDIKKIQSQLSQADSTGKDSDLSSNLLRRKRKHIKKPSIIVP